MGYIRKVSDFFSLSDVRSTSELPAGASPPRGPATLPWNLPNMPGWMRSRTACGGTVRPMPTCLTPCRDPHRPQAARCSMPAGVPGACCGFLPPRCPRGRCGWRARSRPCTTAGYSSTAVWKCRPGRSWWLGSCPVPRSLPAVARRRTSSLSIQLLQPRYRRAGQESVGRCRRHLRRFACAPGPFAGSGMPEKALRTAA